MFLHLVEPIEVRFRVEGVTARLTGSLDGLNLCGAHEVNLTGVTVKYDVVHSSFSFPFLIVLYHNTSRLSSKKLHNFGINFLGKIFSKKLLTNGEKCGKIFRGATAACERKEVWYLPDLHKGFHNLVAVQHQGVIPFEGEVVNISNLCYIGVSIFCHEPDLAVVLLLDVPRSYIKHRERITARSLRLVLFGTFCHHNKEVQVGVLRIGRAVVIDHINPAVQEPQQEQSADTSEYPANNVKLFHFSFPFRFCNCIVPQQADFVKPFRKSFFASFLAFSFSI